MTTIPGPAWSPAVEKYMAVAPTQSTAAGFTPRDVFITQSDDIYKFSGGILTPFVTGFGCPFSDHTSITFDNVGTFGNNMIVTCENGPVCKVDRTSRRTTCHAHRVLGRHPHIEGPAVVPVSFGPFGGQILVADDVNGVVDAIGPDDTVTLNAFNWVSPDWAGAESVQVIPSNPCPNCSGGAFFQAVFDS